MLKVSVSYGSAVCSLSLTPRMIVNRNPGYSSTLTRLTGLSASSTASGWNANTLSSIAMHWRLVTRMSIHSSPVPFWMTSRISGVLRSCRSLPSAAT